MTEGNFLNKLFKNIFYLHLVSITILVIVLAIRGMLSASHTHHFDTQDWYLPVLVSTAFAAIAGFAWQALTAFNPLRTMKVAFWLSPLLIGLVGFLLVSIGTTGSLAAAAIAVVSAVTQSLYWCWVQPRLEYAGQVLLLSIAIPPQIATGVAFLSIITCTLYSSLLFFGIGGAVICVIRGSARAISMVSKDADEFMFSCTSCYSAIASRLVAYGNRWGFVHIGLHNKGIVQSSKNIWEMFQRAGIEQLINSDLTSSFCFLSGTAGGAACALLGGSWALMSRRNYATEVSIYTFLSGYFMIRVAMSWIQAGVSAYYVAYAENPQNQKFDCTIPKFIEELQRSRV